MGYTEIYKESLKAGAVKSLKPSFMKWEKEGQEVIGRYKGKAGVTSTMNDGMYYHYIFDTDFGLVKFSLGAATDGEVANLFQLDEIYRIEYLGKEKTTGGFSVNQFNIQALVMPEPTEPSIPTQPDLPKGE